MNSKIALALVFSAGIVFAGFLLFFYWQPVQQNPNAFLSLEGEITGKEDFEQRRANLLNDLSDEIDRAVLEGKYHCCIEPACTMCYLGNWIWDDGTCDCDAMIAAGEFDSVCPQCKRGIEEGRCTSTIEEPCEVEANFE